jgi:hypothetical protein
LSANAKNRNYNKELMDYTREAREALTVKTIDAAITKTKEKICPNVLELDGTV